MGRRVARGGKEKKKEGTDGKREENGWWKGMKFIYIIYLLFITLHIYVFITTEGA